VPGWCGYNSNLWGYQVHNALVIGGGVIPGVTSIGTTRVRWGWRNNENNGMNDFGSDDIYTGIGTITYSAGNSYNDCGPVGDCYVAYPDHPGGRALSFALFGRGAAITPPASPPSLAAFYVDVGGTAVGVQCDTASANGGGWLLVLNYVHLGGSNPTSLNTRNSSTCPPFISSQTLGSDEQASTGCGGAWGQLDQATLAQVRARAPAAAAAARASFAPAVLAVAILCSDRGVVPAAL
jgi:hypothetical protein